MDDDSYEMNLMMLTANLHFEHYYGNEAEAQWVRKLWRSVGRKAGIKVRTYDVKQLGFVQVERLTVLPQDVQIEKMAFAYARDKMRGA
jgi:hypothetical protein